MRRPSGLVKTCAALFLTVLVCGCEAKVYGTTGAQPEGPQLTMVSADSGPGLPPQTATEAPTATLDGLETRARQATTDASNAGADISVDVLDRTTGVQISNGNPRSLALASVVKLFIADDLLLRESLGQTTLSADDRKSLDLMLRSSDDGAAETFWDRSGGGSAIVQRVAARYGLSSTTPPGNGRWFNTISTATDLVKYYNMLLEGTGGLPPDRAAIIIDDLAQSTPLGVDGYPQRFGIPEGLAGESVAVKQGWMCCIGSDWLHLSTGIIGPDHRYIMVIGSMQATDDATARRTITAAVKTMFPSGQI